MQKCSSVSAVRFDISATCCSRHHPSSSPLPSISGYSFYSMTSSCSFLSRSRSWTPHSRALFESHFPRIWSISYLKPSISSPSPNSSSRTDLLIVPILTVSYAFHLFSTPISSTDPCYRFLELKCSGSSVFRRLSIPFWSFPLFPPSLFFRSTDFC